MMNSTNMLQQVIVCLLVAICSAQLPCQLMKAKETENCGNPPKNGCHVSQCNADGTFVQPQVTDSGVTFCVNEQTGKIVGSKVDAAHGPAKCVCHVQRSKGCVTLKGCFVPECDPDGSFSQPQSDLTGQTFCVDEEGRKIASTAVTNALANCMCQKIRNSGCGTPPRPNCYLVKCNPNGSFAQLQTDSSGTFCVDDKGMKIVRTVVPLGRGTALCGLGFDALLAAVKKEMENREQKASNARYVSSG